MSRLDLKERDLVKCEDMRIHAARAVKFMGDLSFEAFCKDDMAQAAVIRCVEVVGEAARLVSEESRYFSPEIPWRLITGMRNVLAHDYGAVDLDKVYEVVTLHLPALLENLERLIGELEQAVGWVEED